jgi:hypothetical protein
MEALKDAGREYLHTSEYLNSIPLVGGLRHSDETVGALLAPFLKCIKHNITQRGVGICVITDCASYHGLPRDDKRFIRPPDLHSFEMAMALLIKHTRTGLGDRHLAIQFDECSDACKLYGCYRDTKQNNETLRRYLGSIAFVDDKKHPPIQAADMLGNIVLKTWRRLGSEGKPHPLVNDLILEPTGLRNTDFVIHRTYHLEKIADMRRRAKVRSTDEDIDVS